jgi:hypothetical protein
MVLDVEPAVLPSRNLGGEFIGKIPIAGCCLSWTPAPLQWIDFWLWVMVYPKKEAEKIPMGFNSEESFTEMDEDCNIANGIRVEMMELKPIEIKKATEKRARGEGQTPFGKMVKCDDFVYIFHGKRFAKRGVPVDKTFILEQTLGNKFLKIIVGALTVSPLPRRRLRLLLLPILLRSLGRHFLIRLPRVAQGLWRKGRRDLIGLGLSKGVKAECGSDWGILKILGRLQIESTVFTWCYRGVK